MPKPIEKFDKVFELLFLVTTIILTISIGLLKDYQQYWISFVIYSVMIIFSFSFWSFGHFMSYSYNEAFLKLLSWFTLMIYTLIFISSLILKIPNLANLPASIQLIVISISFLLTIPIYYYLKFSLFPKAENWLILFYISLLIIVIYQEIIKLIFHF